MATKQLYATGTFKYQNRMLKSGDPVVMTDPLARLYMALGKVTEDKPKASPAPTQASDLNQKTKADLAKMAGLSATEAKKLTKAQILAKL